MEQNLKKIALDKLQVGDILLFPAPKDSWLSQAIALLTDSSVSHAALLSQIGHEEYVIAEATIGGLKYTPLPAEYPYVFRYNNISSEQQEELLRTVRMYMEEGDDYGYADLVLLGILLLYKKFSKKTLSNRKIYLFLLVISVPLQKAVQRFISKGKHPMVCSQFVAQCYTDADCDLKFDRMKIDYGKIVGKIAASNSKPIQMNLCQKAIKSILKINTENLSDLMRQLFYKKDIINQFLQLMKEDKMTKLSDDRSDTGFELERETILSEPSLTVPVQLITKILEPVLLGLQSNSNGKNKMSTIRNFFVTPADLLSNCNNTIDMGQLDDKVDKHE